MSSFQCRQFQGQFSISLFLCLAYLLYTLKNGVLWLLSISRASFIPILFAWGEGYGHGNGVVEVAFIVAILKTHTPLPFFSTYLFSTALNET